MKIHLNLITTDIVKTEIKNINRIIELDYNLMPNNSLLLIFGDHGIIGEKGRYGGNRGHGGKTKEEIEAGFIAMTKQKGFTFQLLTQEYIFLSEKGLELWKKIKGKVEGIGKFLNRSQFNQVDIVPSMARMFKFPIPNSNLGVIIPEIMNYQYLDQKIKNVISNSFYNLFFDHLLNFLQIYNFLEKTHEKEKDSELQNICEEFKLNMEYIESKLRNILPNKGRIFQFEIDFLEKETVLDEELIEEFIMFVETCFDLVMKMRKSMEPMHEFFQHRWNYINSPLLYISIAAIFINITILLYFLNIIPSNNIQHYIQWKGSFICSFFGIILLIVPLIPVIILDNYYIIYFIYLFALFSPFYVKLFRCCTWTNVKLFIGKYKPLQTPILGIIGTFSMLYLASSPFLFKRKSKYLYILYNIIDFILLGLSGTISLLVIINMLRSFIKQKIHLTITFKHKIQIILYLILFTSSIGMNFFFSYRTVWYMKWKWFSAEYFANYKHLIYENFWLTTGISHIGIFVYIVYYFFKLMYDRLKNGYFCAYLVNYILQSVLIFYAQFLNPDQEIIRRSLQLNYLLYLLFMTLLITLIVFRKCTLFRYIEVFPLNEQLQRVFLILLMLNFPLIQMILEPYRGILYLFLFASLVFLNKLIILFKSENQSHTLLYFTFLFYVAFLCLLGEDGHRDDIEDGFNKKSLFLGLEKFNMIISPLQLILNWFGAFIVAILATFILHLDEKLHTGRNNFRDTYESLELEDIPESFHKIGDHYCNY